MNWENLTIETIARLTEAKKSFQDCLASWNPFRVDDPEQRRILQARIAKINRELARRQAQRRRWEERLDSMSEPFR